MRTVWKILIKSKCLEVEEKAKKYLYSLFWLTSLIYAVKFEFENPAILEDKQCKQTERYSIMAKESDCSLSLDDKSKQRYKVKINNIQGYDPHQIKKEKLSGNIVWLSPLTIEELKVYESLESYNQFASWWVQEVKIKLFLNYLLKLPWLLDGSVHNVFPSLFYFSILIRCTVFIGSAKIPEREGSISPSSF